MLHPMFHFTMEGKFQNFDLLSTTYKTVDNVSINADVLVPKNLTAGLHPSIFRFHGGGFVSHSITTAALSF